MLHNTRVHKLSTHNTNSSGFTNVHTKLRAMQILDLIFFVCTDQVKIFSVFSQLIQGTYKSTIYFVGYFLEGTFLFVITFS